ncbi:Hsp20/alpha crystallin family protein [Agarilytica rhodophyticola]|uniref:Hsp20/alpha crystallin family protein n=1 Tax=Agarilytica rhodophyticola TaxID=1737490 RepID=UPI000B347CF8|nr:Hsp20/alpha crystallin family protein [Agarilytica rhodophyticola]
MSLMSHDSIFNFDDLFEHFYPALPKSSLKSDFFSPRVDVKEKKDHYEIAVDLPGVDKKDVSVTLENGVLTLEATTEDERTEEKDGRIIRKERRSGKFMRSFTIGNNVHEADINANFKNGVLTLIAPKIQESTVQSKRIDIN